VRMAIIHFVFLTIHQILGKTKMGFTSYGNAG
jgi:hypothetical protein